MNNNYPDPYSFGTTKIYEQKIKDVKAEEKMRELSADEMAARMEYDGIWGFKA